MGENDYFDYHEREAEDARCQEATDKRERFEPPAIRLTTPEKASVIQLTLVERLDGGTGEYIPREPGDTANSLLCEILGLLSNNTMGDEWRGPERSRDR